MTTPTNCRLERRKQDGTLVGYICRVHNRLCTSTDCEVCQHEAKHIDSPKWHPPMTQPVPNYPRPPKGVSSALGRIADTLSPPVEGRDRPMTVEPDGTIIYTKESNDEEPPRLINGYEPDPDNPWQMNPLWLACDLRAQSGVRYAACGCIDVIMRCNNPVCKLFGRRLCYINCATCMNRKTLEA